MTQHPEEGTLHAYIDGELSAADTAAFELHVGECAQCAEALAEARGFVAAASRVITTLDAAPSSAAKPAAPVAGVAAAPLKRVVRPSVFRVPYARAAALLLLVGGTAFVVDRTGTFARGKNMQAESLAADASTESDVAATGAAEAVTASATGPMTAPGVAAAAGVSTGAGSRETGSVRREAVARGKVAVGTTDGTARARSVERSAPPSETAPAAFAGRGIAGGVATKEVPAPSMAQPSILAGRDAAPEVAKPTVLPAAPPPPARLDMRLQERTAASALSVAPTVVRFRTREGIVVTLTEEPLRTTFAEESVTTLQSAPPPAQRRAAAPMAAPPINSYRWSNAEGGKIYTLSGPMTVADLEALSKRLSELERLP